MRKLFLYLIGTILSASFIIYTAPVSIAADEEKKESEDEDMITVPRGWFKMGSDIGELNEAPEHDVFLDKFKIDRYEVSATEFAKFLNDKGNPDDKYFTEDKYAMITSVTDPDTGKKKYMPRKGFENHPANNVSWYGADEFCKSKGKRLPSEAEWEKATRGEDGRLYPWGDDKPDASKAAYDKNWKTTGANSMSSVDSFPDSASPYGAYGLSGNVWEWTNDWYRQNYCDFCDPHGTGYIDTASKLTDQENKSEEEKDKEKEEKKKKQKSGTMLMENPEGPEKGQFKSMRGGSWYDSYGDIAIKSTYRFWMKPGDRYINTGFRCVK